MCIAGLLVGYGFFCTRKQVKRSCLLALYAMAPTGSSHVNASLAVLCAAGGVFGYLKAKSAPSLVAGLAFGAAYGAGAYLITSGDPATGHLAGLVSSVLLTGAMGVRFAKTGKVMPAGVMTAAGVLGSLYNFQKHQEWTS